MKSKSVLGLQCVPGSPSGAATPQPYYCDGGPRLPELFGNITDYWKQPLINEFSLVSMQTANRAGRQTQREKPSCGFYCCVHFSLRRKLSILRSSTGARTITFLCVQWSAETRLENSVHSFRARTDRRTNGRTDEWTDGRTNERTQRGVAESASQITGSERRVSDRGRFCHRKCRTGSITVT
jgi:hypothetical protein